MHDGVAGAQSKMSQPQSLSIEQLREMAARQQQQIEMQQQQLVAKEQRLKYLKQQEYQHHQMASEYDRLRRCVLSLTFFHKDYCLKHLNIDWSAAASSFESLIMINLS